MAEPEFWIERWERGDIGFHQAAVHDFLTAHWPLLDAQPGSAVFVPLCGKSLDMVWLADRGHTVIGCELSPLAVDDFFREQGIEADLRSDGPFVIRQAGPYTIWCGDVFELPAGAVTEVSAVYDRAALVALPPSLQARYAEKLIEVLPASARVLLTGLDYPEGETSGPPFATPETQVESLFGPAYDIRIAERRDGLEQSQNLKKRGVTALEETAYILSRNTG